MKTQDCVEQLSDALTISFYVLFNKNIRFYPPV